MNGKQKKFRARGSIRQLRRELAKESEKADRYFALYVATRARVITMEKDVREAFGSANVALILQLVRWDEPQVYRYELVAHRLLLHGGRLQRVPEKTLRGRCLIDRDLIKSIKVPEVAVSASLDRMGADMGQTLVRELRGIPLPS